jgi:hypothetical protein
LRHLLTLNNLPAASITPIGATWGEQMKALLAGAAMAALISTSLSAQSAPVETSAPAEPAPVAASAPAPALLTLSEGVPIQLAVAEEVNSSTHRAGDTFRLTVLNDVLVGNTVVIPRGTPAQAEITWRTGKGAFGKSGKLEFSLDYVDLNGQHIPLSGSFRQEGEGNTVATGVGIIAVGVLAGFITGKRARLPVGRELMGQLASPVQFTTSGALAPSYDSRAAMAAAEAATPIGQCRAAARRLPSRQQERALRECFRERMD